MDKHLLTDIHIKDFKCFKDFKAEGFKRVNLIGGKNNVGKTAFMEACYLGVNASLCHKNDGRLMNTRLFFNALITIELSRNPFLEFRIIEDSNEFEFKYTKSEIILNGSLCSIGSIKEFEYSLYDKPSNDYEHGITKIIQFYQGKNKPLDIKNNTFISMNGIRGNYISDCVDDIKLSSKWDSINNQLNSIFKIKRIDVIKNTVMLEYENKYLHMNEFGDGLKHFVSILISINLNKDSIIFLDEVDNGLHYSNFDKLWEIILTISKEQNVQVFATTHSKECIESYARVSKKLEDEETTYIKMSRLKDGSVMAGVRDYEMLQYTMEDGHEVRGV